MTDASPSRFDVLPAIDLIGGRVVRLRQGDFDQATEFSDRPSAVAEQFVADGAAWLHIVDLDGARSGTPVQYDIVAEIIKIVAGRAQVEVSGGLRTHEAIDAAIAAGAARAVLGTAAIRNPRLLADAVDRHGPDRIAVAIDVRDGVAVGEGWRHGAAGLPPAELVRTLADAGTTTFEVTAIDRDGLLGGPDLALIGTLVALDRGAIIASGGIHGSDDIRAVVALGCRGAIVGRALYDGSMSLREALAAAGKAPV